MADDGGVASAATDARTVGALVSEMSALLEPSLGDDALREARELLAALHDMPRHWPTVEQAHSIGADELGSRAARRGASGEGRAACSTRRARPPSGISRSTSTSAC